MGSFINSKGKTIELKEFNRSLSINVLGTFLVNKYAVK